MKELELVVRDRRDVADRVVELTLGARTGSLPDWAPGAHIDLILDEPEAGRPPTVRQYSLCGLPGERSPWRVAVLLERDGRGGSRFVHDRVRPGARLRARGPRNLFPLVESPSTILVAGGIGITPLLPMAHRLASRGADWRMLYGGRSRKAMAYLDELDRYGDTVQVVPQDESGLPDLEAALGAPRANTSVYCCGPAAMIAEVARVCETWPPGTLRYERFQPVIEADTDAGADGDVAPSPADGGAGFEVELARTGRLLTVPPGQSVLDALQAAGVPVLSSCAEGTCGTCEIPVLAGVPDHRDTVLTEAEREAGGSMMICVSRSQSPRLVLDL